MMTTTQELRAQVTRELVGADDLLLPPARTFAGVYNAFSKIYSAKWDEAMRHGVNTAQAMRRDAYFSALEQERISPLSRWKWEVVADDGDYVNPKDPYANDREAVRRQIEQIARKTYLLHQVRHYLGYAVWFGRYGSQVSWAQQVVGGHTRWVPAYTDPIEGDKIHFDFSGNPGVLVMPGSMPGYDVRSFDGGQLLMLNRPELRRRFIIHKHLIEDGSFNDPMTAGRRHGRGLRDCVHWAWWLRDEMLSWLMDFMEKVGSLGLILVFYKSGNAKSKAQAEKTAREMRGRNAIAVPRGPAGSDDEGGVEVITPQMGGVQFLKDVVVDVFERHIERLFVGQTLSAGTEGSGLGGSGVANMHMNTKHNLLEFDAENQAETFTSDLVEPIKYYNFRNAPWSYRWLYRLPDPMAKEKLTAIEQGVRLGLKFKASEVRALIGATAPDKDDETVGPKDEPTPAPAVPSSTNTPTMPDLSNVPTEFLQFALATRSQNYDRADLVLADVTTKDGDTVKRWVSKDDAAGGGAEPGQDRSGAPAQDDTSKEVLQEPTPEQTEAVVSDSKLSRALGFAKRAAGRVKAAADVLKNTGLARFIFAVEHKVMISAHKCRDVCEAAAAERGMSEEQSARLKSSLALADTIVGWVGGGILAVAVNPVASKIGYLPTVSAFYLAYSTARDPLATFRAAKKVVKESSLNPVTAAKDIWTATRGEAVPHSLADYFLSYAAEEATTLPDWAAQLADSLATNDAELAEMRQAVFLLALAASEDVKAAASLAASVREKVDYAADWTSGSDEQGPFWRSSAGAIRRTPPPKSAATQSQKRGGAPAKGESRVNPAGFPQSLKAPRYSRKIGAAAAAELLAIDQATKAALSQEGKPSAEQRLLINQANYKAEVLTAAALGGEHYGKSGAIDVLVSGLDHESGRTFDANIDVKLVGSKDSSYTSTQLSSLNKLRASSRNSITCILAINTGPDIENNGVYAKLGTGSFRAKEGPEVVRLLTSEEMKGLNTMEGQRLLNKRFREFIRGVDLPKYRAGLRNKGERVHMSAIEHFQEADEAAKKLGVSKEKRIANVAAALQGETAEVVVAAGLSKLAPGQIAALASVLTPEQKAELRKLLED